MILGRAEHYHARCFDEISTAVDQYLIERNDPRIVVFNAHAFPGHVQPGQIIYNLENVGIQIGGEAFASNEIWDFSARNVSKWSGVRAPVHHVPVGHHASMERFQPLPWADRDIDVVFFGWMNLRRQLVIDGLLQRGIKAEAHNGTYEAGRDAILARSKIAINMLYYEDGTFPTLRTAHFVANSIASIAENAIETPAWVHPAPVLYAQVVDACCDLLAQGESTVTRVAAEALAKFRASPLRLPQPT